MDEQPRKIALAMTGASGAQYGLRLLECLINADIHVYLMLSKPAHVVIGMETDVSLPSRASEIANVLSELYAAAPGQIEVLGEQQWTAPIASGSGVPEAMVICPCTTGTLSAVAVGSSRSLMERAADVVLKERRRLILVLRETPLSEIHLENMLRLTRMGALMMPANPGFYHRPRNTQDLVDFMVARVLDQLFIPQTLLPPWGDDIRND